MESLVLLLACYVLASLAPAYTGARFARTRRAFFRSAVSVRLILSGLVSSSASAVSTELRGRALGSGLGGWMVVAAEGGSIHQPYRAIRDLLGVVHFVGPLVEFPMRQRQGVRGESECSRYVPERCIKIARSSVQPSLLR